MPSDTVENNLPPQKASSPGNGNDAYFWPVLILIIGTLFSTGYQIVMMQYQLDALTQAASQMDNKVRQAQYEKAKLYKLASDVLQLSATNANARQIVTDYKIQGAAPPPAIPSAAK